MPDAAPLELTDITMKYFSWSVSGLPLNMAGLERKRFIM
jgi:hypothetical protein